jgi:outer membrane protein TolC
MKASLEELVAEALSNNPGLTASKEEREAARAKVLPSALPPNPTVGLGFGMIPEDDFDLGKATMRTLSLSQRIPFPGKLVSRNRRASHVAGVVDEMHRMREREVVRKVKDEFWDLYRLHESVRITGELKDLLLNLARIAETKYAVGKGFAGDVLKAQVELAKLENDLFTLNRQVLTTEAGMKALLGKTDDVTVGEPEVPSLRPLALSIDALDSLALHNRPQLLAAREMEKVASSAHLTSKMDYFPDFMLTLKHQNVDMGMDTWEVMFSAEIPVWLPFRENKMLEETGANLASARAYVESATNDALSAVASAYNRYESARRTLELYETGIIPQAEMSLLSAQAAYENDLRDFLSLLDAERSLLKFRLEYAGAQAEYEKSIAELEMVVGRKLPRDEGGE